MNTYPLSDNAGVDFNALYSCFRSRYHQFNVFTGISILAQRRLSSATCPPAMSPPSSQQPRWTGQMPLQHLESPTSTPETSALAEANVSPKKGRPCYLFRKVPKASLSMLLPFCTHCSSSSVSHILSPSTLARTIEVLELTRLRPSFRTIP